MFFWLNLDKLASGYWQEGEKGSKESTSSIVSSDSVSSIGQRLHRRTR